MLKVLGISAILIAFLLIGCDRDKLPEITGECNEVVSYVDQIEPIMNQKCSFSGCHDGATAPGDMRTYNSAKPYLNAQAGNFEDRVIAKMNMPEAPTMLSDDEFELMKCWVINGYPEN